MNARTKWTRVAVDGDTIDGREITRQQIQEMADTYDPNVYGARVWSEHFRALIPGGPFDALGDVVAAKAEEVSEGGDLDGRLGLYVQVDALPPLVHLAQVKQKIYQSIEMATNFAGRGHAYLVGLAATDTPASLGTQVFAFGATGQSVMAGAQHETHLEFEDQSHSSGGGQESSLLSRIRELVSGQGGQAPSQSGQHSGGGATSGEQTGGQSGSTGGHPSSDPERRIQELAGRADRLETAIQELASKIDEARAPEAAQDQAAGIQDLAQKVDALAERLSAEPSPNASRAPATGGDGRQTTDC